MSVHFSIVINGSEFIIQPGTFHSPPMEKNSHYSNCHSLTYDCIQAIKNILPQGNIQLNPIFNSFGKENTNLNELYNQLIPYSTPFSRETCNNLSLPSLVLFVLPANENSGKHVSHSMLSLDFNMWIGANNLGSLGCQSAFPMDVPIGVTSTLNATDEFVYIDMYTRMHISKKISEYQDLQGGWENEGEQKNKLVSITNDVYDMRFIPIFQMRQ